MSTSEISSKKDLLTTYITYQLRHLDTMKLFLLSAAALLAIANGATLRGSEQTTEVSSGADLYDILCMCDILCSYELI